LFLRGEGPGFPLLLRRHLAGSDSLEQEADRLVDRVLPASDRNLAPPRVPQRRSATAPHIVHEAIRLPGKPLNEPTRAFMEPRFGHDFSGVRVHTDAKASDSAHALNALAYTVGSDVFFRSDVGPETSSGMHVLAHELAHVQQQAGDATGRQIQCYGSPEHQDLGDRYLTELLAFLQTEEGAQWAKKIGLDRDQLVADIRLDPTRRGTKIRLGPRPAKAGAVENPELAPSDIIALFGDFFGTVDELVNAPTEKVQAVLSVMRDERQGTVENADKEYERITGGGYLKLAEKNDTHFARRNRAEWRRLHDQATEEAKTAGGREGKERPERPAGAGKQDEERFQRALLIDAAASHFLTDAYAAGHLFDSSELLAAIAIRLSKQSAVTQNPQMQGYVGGIALVGRLPKLVLKNIHDRMNREGFEVTNARGMHWRTFGDNYLSLAQETQRVASLAVFLSRQQVHAARRGAPFDPQDIVALMPDENTVKRATQQAISYIPDAVAGVESLIYRNRSLAPSQFGTVLGTIIESNLSTIGDPGREKQLEQMLDSARRIGQKEPVVAPSFTLFDF
jgi:hypothetical protein